MRELVEKYHVIRGELSECSKRQEKTQTLKCNFLEVCEKRLKKCEGQVEQHIQQVESCRHRLIGLFGIPKLQVYFKKENHNNRLDEAERLSSEDENKLDQEITSSESTLDDYDDTIASSYVVEQEK